MSSAVISRIVSELKARPGALLPILHAVQEELGHVPESAIPIIASELNLTRAEVHGVVTFYHDFRSHPAGKHIVKICQAESCQAVGSARLTTHARERLDIDFHQTTADRSCTLEPVYCLGNCALSPAMMVDGDLYGRVTTESARHVVDEKRKES